MPATLRKWHRRISMAFLATVIGVFAIQSFTMPPMWLYYLPLPFLFALMLNGVYMLVRHYRPASP